MNALSIDEDYFPSTGLHSNSNFTKVRQIHLVKAPFIWRIVDAVVTFQCSCIVITYDLKSIIRQVDIVKFALDWFIWRSRNLPLLKPTKNLQLDLTLLPQLLAEVLTRCCAIALQYNYDFQRAQTKISLDTIGNQS